MKKFKFSCKKGYNYYIIICENVTCGLKIIENYLKNKYPNYTHYVNKDDFNIEEMAITFVELQNVVLEVANIEHINSSHEQHTRYNDYLKELVRLGIRTIPQDYFNY